MKKQIRTILAAILMIAGSLNAQNSIMAYASRDSIVKSVPGYLEKMKQLDETAKGYQEELKTKREQLNRKIAQLLQPYDIKQDENEQQIRLRMSSKDTTALGMLQQEDILLKQTEKLYNAKVKTAYEGELKPIEEKIKATIKLCAVKNKLDILFFIEDISPALAYVNTRRSLTKDIIKELASMK